MICNHGVAGSSPAAGTNRFKDKAQPSWLGFVFYGLRFNGFEVCGFPLADVSAGRDVGVDAQVPNIEVVDQAVSKPLRVAVIAVVT